MNLSSLLIDLLEKALIMLRSAVAIVGIIGLAANLHLLRHYLPSGKPHIHKTRFKDEKWNKDDSDFVFKGNARGHNSTNPGGVDALEWRKPILGDVMEALADPNTHLIGVYGSDNVIKDALLEKVYRRVQRDKMFGMVVRASITKYPDLRKIQENIASQLGLTFNHKSKDKRAMELIHRINNEQSILIVLGDLYKGFDLSEVGILHGKDHKGCKVLLTFTSEDDLSNHIHTRKNFNTGQVILSRSYKL